MNDSVRPSQSPNRLNLKIKNYRRNVRKLVKIPEPPPSAPFLPLPPPIFLNILKNEIVKY